MVTTCIDTSSSTCGANRQPSPPQLEKINNGIVVEEVSFMSGDFSCSFSEIVRLDSVEDEVNLHANAEQRWERIPK